MKILNAVFVFLSLSLISAATLAQGNGLPSFYEGEDYGQVRIKMIKAGWEPYVRPGSDICDEFDPRCKGRPEMEVCAGTGEGNCRFNWKKEHMVVGICTIGEEVIFQGFCD